ncbi:hypothetical protein GCM10027298_06560 [Epidermidibacterium keratini]
MRRGGFSGAHKIFPLIATVVLATAACTQGAAGRSVSTTSAPPVASGSASSSSSSQPPPSIDYAAPTPTAPDPSGPQQGQAPDGSTVGGPGLDTRDTALADGVPTLPAGIDAKGFVVADVTSGQVLAARDPHGRYLPASTLKTLMLLALYPKLDPAQVLVASFEDATVEGSRVGIVENGQYPISELWTALMLQSGNDAANMLMNAFGGREATAAAMNEYAAGLQAYDTLAGNPSGLDVAGQSSSPYDLALFMRQIIADPALRAIVSQPLGALSAQPPKYPAPLQFGNQNHLVGQYPGAIGAKNGFTDAARHTYVAAAEQGGRTLVVSLMQAEMQPTPSYLQAQSLLSWGFATAPDAAGLGVLIAPDTPTPTASAASPIAGNAAAASASGSDSGSASSAAAGDGSSSPNAQAGNQPVAAQHDRVESWPLLPILGVLLVIAIWIAAPRGPRRRG